MDFKITSVEDAEIVRSALIERHTALIGAMHSFRCVNDASGHQMARAEMAAVERMASRLGADISIAKMKGGV